MLNRTKLIMQKVKDLSCKNISVQDNKNDVCLPEMNIDTLPVITEDGIFLHDDNDGSSNQGVRDEQLFNICSYKETVYHELVPLNSDSSVQPVEIMMVMPSSTEGFAISYENGISEISQDTMITNYVEEVQNSTSLVQYGPTNNDSSEPSNGSSGSGDYMPDPNDTNSSSDREEDTELLPDAGSNSVPGIPDDNEKDVDKAHETFNQPQSSVNEKSDIQYTKSGEIRKRRKYQENPSERKKQKHEETKNKHPVLPPCDKCKLKCMSQFSEERRNYINRQFWDLSYIQRRAYVLNSCERLNVKRRSKEFDDSGSKKFTFKYTLKTENETIKHVCKKFYLTTLGFKHTNDRFVYEVLSKTPKGSIIPVADKRGKRCPPNYIPKDEINDHIESFQPVISHYRREHAPNVRYLPSDITIAFMYQDFLEKNPTIEVSYNVYRVQVKRKNISFAKLGNEECEICEYFNLHGHSKENMLDDCDICCSWRNHIELAAESRELHKKIATGDRNSLCFSADLEKIIMLPRVDTFKKVIFTKRLTVYNESFVPLGKKSKTNPFAALWHEGISGRNQEDIVSTFYAFFKRQRDSPSLSIWLDNCSSQNKNWCFFTFLVYIINSDEVSTSDIIINYFEPGHTFMSADNFYHQVELSLKKQGKTYDFPDFVRAVQSANSGRVEIKEMNHKDFYKWMNHSSQKKLKQPNRTHLKNIVQVIATRGSYCLLYKTSYSETEPLNCLDFLTVKAMKNGIKLPEYLTKPSGFSIEKRDNILKNLHQILPQNRRKFWLNIPTSTTPS